MRIEPIRADYHGIETASYLLLSGNEGVLIDTGSAPIARQKLIPELKRLARRRSFKLSTIVNTHSHADHSGGNQLLKSIWHSKILVHSLESKYISDRRKAVAEHFSTDTHFPAPSRREVDQLKRDLGPSAKVDRSLKDGSRIEFGDSTLKVLHTPGHSAGSIAIYEPQEGLLLCGDAVQGTGVQASFPTLPIYSDVDAYENSLSKLRELDVTEAYLGHAFLPLAKCKLRQKEFRGFISHSLDAIDRLGRVVEKYADEGKSAIGISHRLMVESGWCASDPVPIFVLKSVEAFLRSNRSSQ